MTVAREEAAVRMEPEQRMEHQISFRQVPAGRVRCTGCGLVFTLVELLASPGCLGAAARASDALS